MEMQVEPKHGRRSIWVDVELFYVNCVDGIEVAVRGVSGRRVSAEVGALAGIVAQADDAVNAQVLCSTGIGRQLAYLDGNIDCLLYTSDAADDQSTV